MQGILNKSSNGVSTEQSSPPFRPPKHGPRRVIPHFRLPAGLRKLAKWKNANGSHKSDDKSGKGVRVADPEEEPKTEDSFDYKDIDLASEIFDFRVPAQPNRIRKPPRPPPPPPSPPSTNKQSNVNGKTVAFSDIPLIDEGQNEPDEIEEKKAHREVEIIVEAEPEEVVERDQTNQMSEVLTPEQKLTKFLRDHDGLDLSPSDVEELEKLLNETDEAEKAMAEEVNTETCTMECQTQFDDNEVINDVANLESPKESNLNGIEIHLEEEPKGHTDFSVVEFNKTELKTVQSSKKAVDDGIYEPVGEPIPTCRKPLQKPPDMSGFVPPKASPNIGDPFAWRRRGMRRWDRYGYEKSKTDPYIPASDQIYQGCQQVECYIVSRDLSPPGYLLGILGTNRKLKRRKKKKKKVPTISVIHPPLLIENCQPITKSYEEKVSNEILQETFEELKKNHFIKSESPGDPEKTAVVDIMVIKSRPQDDDDIIKSPNEIEGNILNNNVVSDDITSDTEASCQKENIPETTNENVPKILEEFDLVVSTQHVSRKDACNKKERPPRPLPPTPSSIQEFTKPVRPSRRPKRVSSAEPPVSKSPERPLPDIPFQTQTFPRTKTPSVRRSVSSAEVQKRIQIQAQQFFRTPRKKEMKLLSPRHLTKSQAPSSSITLYEDSMRHRQRKSRLAPVYTPINKTSPRKKEIASQTDEAYDVLSDDEESIPPPPPPKMRHLLASAASLNEIHNDDVLHDEYETETAAFSDVETSVTPEVAAELCDKIRSASPLPPTEEHESSPISRLPIVNGKYLKLGSTDVQMALFCGFLPVDGNHPSTLNEFPEMTIHRLNVNHLEAGFIKVAQVEADRLSIQRLEQLNSLSPQSQITSNYSAANSPNVPESGQQQSLPEQSTQQLNIQPHVEEENIQRSNSVVDVNGNDSFISEKPLNWDDNSSWTGRFFPSSSSASYVTCDETLHESITDSEFGTDIEEGFGTDDEEATAGGPTPVPLDLEQEKEDDYDLLRQVFAAAVANNSQLNNNNLLP